MQHTITKITLLALAFVMLHACYDVEEGYRIDYVESNARVNIETEGLNRGAIKDTIKFKIDVQANKPIKTLTVTSTLSGGTGTGYVIPENLSDPFIDHSFGTVKENTSDIDVYYYYVIGQDTSNVKLTFIMVDGEGKTEIQKEVITAPGITRYNNISMYSYDNSKTDGFSTIDGIVYHYLPNYEPVTVANQLVQESLDMVFVVENGSALLVAPYDWHYNSSMQVKNKTKFKKIESIELADFEKVTAASLSFIASNDSIKDGSTNIYNIKVNDIIGYQTDFASSNSYKYGLIKVNAIHPTNSEWYEGVSYVIEMDVVTQK